MKEQSELVEMNFMLLSELTLFLRDNCGTDLFEYVKAYYEKESFGDIDVVVNSKNLRQDYKDNIAYHVGTERTSSNGGVFSFVFLDMQVDLIVTQDKYFKSACDYFAWNDLGNILGRLCHKLGFKLGHKGLSLVVREPVEYGGHILEEIELSQNYSDALEILGLDVNKFNSGFNNLEEMFEYVASSKFFDPEIYLLDNRAHYSKVRDRKRKTYHEFLEWCKRVGIEAKYSFSDKSERGGYSIREPFYSDIILKKYPWVEGRVNSLIENDKLDKKFKTMYNGEIVRRLQD